MQGRSYTNLSTCVSMSTATPSRGTLLYHKSWGANGATDLSCGDIWVATAMKCAKLIKHIAHRSSRAWPWTALGI